ncbi:MAG: hypothetical protein R6V86_02390 [Spirochaetia bacterium]
MRISINEQAIDFSLENEKTLGEVIDGIHTWLEDSGYQIFSLEYDGNTIVPSGEEDDKWKLQPVDQMQNLDITVLSATEQYGQDLHTLYQYLSLLQRALASDNRELIKDLKNELPYIVANIDRILGSHSEYGHVLEKLVEGSGIKEGEIKPAVQQLSTYLNNLLIILQSRINEVTQPLTEIRSTAEGLRALIPQLMDVSVYLQTGKDKQAMNSIIEFTEISEKLIRLYRILQNQGITDLSKTRFNEQDFTTFYSELNEIFNELEDAFNSKDSVLIGDLLEYEVAPRTERLMEFILTIENNLDNSKTKPKNKSEG